jgi:hypothetical protein
LVAATDGTGVEAEADWAMNGESAQNRVRV